MATGHISANDGTRLHYQDQGEGRPLVLIHGWGFSGRFFDPVIDDLAAHTRVIRVDLRGHGNSDKPGHGYRIPRLAKDLFDLLEALDLTGVTALGWSLGCPVIWSYLELFGVHRLDKAVFVEQSPRQYYAPDWKYAHATCYDDAGLATTCAQVELNTAAFDQDQIDTIMATTPSDQLREMLLAEMAKAPVSARTAIMADHTRHDWRDLLPTIDLSSLVLVARQDAVFDWRGPAFVGESIPGARTVFFEHSGHALFLDEPRKFTATVQAFHTGDVS